VFTDHQAHWYPRAAFDLVMDRPGFPTARRTAGGIEFALSERFRSVLTDEFLELELQLRDMDDNGVSRMVANPAVCPGDVTSFETALAIEMCELLNDEMGRAQRELPDRFLGVASLPWQDADAAVRVLNRAVEEHDLRAVGVYSNIDGGPIAVDDLLPVYRRIEELGRPLVLHPTGSTAMASAYARYGSAVEMISWLFDTSAAALSLIYGGVLDACPGLKVLHPHLGGALPFVRARIASFDRLSGRGTERPVEDYFHERFFVDSLPATPGAYALAEQMYGPDRIVFGTDYPFVPRRAVCGFLRSELGEDGWHALASRSLDW
jgi:aminocarboxymuconate-semialdehyde decarboxylase